MTTIIKAHRKHDYPPAVNAGPLAFVCAVIQAGVEDAMRGDESARKWLDSRDFAHWCEWANLDPDYMRDRIIPMLPKPKPETLLPNRFTLADIERIVRMRRGGVPWVDIGMTFKTSYPYIWTVLRRMGIEPTALQPRTEAAQ